MIASLRTMLAALALAATAAALPAAAQGTYPAPNRPVKIIVPLAAGGSTDVLARLLADKLRERLGGTFVVENMPGGNTQIANDYVKRQPADGHTLYLVSPQFTAGPATVPQVHKYDPAKDYTPVARVTALSLVLIASNDFPPNTVRELVAYGKANPGKVAVGQTGAGSYGHLAGELFAHAAGTPMLFVHYKGSAPAMVDLIGGRIQLRWESLATARGQMEGKKVKAIAVAENRRSPAAPSVPTVAETLPGFNVDGFFGIVGPAGMPADVVRKLSAEITAIVQQPDMSSKLRELGLDPKPSSAEEFAALLAQDYRQWTTLVKDTGLKIE